LHTMKGKVKYQFVIWIDDLSYTNMDHTKAISMLVTRRSSSGQTRYPNNTHSRYAVTFARSCALCIIE
jgi:hypothetical protein